MFVAAGLVGAVVLTSVLIISNSYFAGTRNAEVTMSSLSVLAAEHTEERLRAFLEPANKVLDRVAERVQRLGRQPDPSQLEQWWFDILEVDPTLSVVAFGQADDGYFMVKRMPDGSLDTKHIHVGATGRKAVWRDRLPGRHFKDVERAWEDPSDAYRASQRVWYSDAIAAPGESVWSDVYVFWSDQRPGVTLSRAVYVGGQLVGVVCVDVNLESISRFVSELVIGGAGRVVLFDDAGHLLSAESVDELVVTKGEPGSATYTPLQATDSTDPLVSTLARALAAPSEKAEIREVAFELADVQYVATVRRMSLGLGESWQIAVVLPTEEFLGPLRETNRQNIWTSVLLGLAALFLVLVITRRVGRSMNLLVAETQEVRQLQLAAKEARDGTFREVAEVLGAFEDMKVGLRAFQKYLPLKLVRQLLKEQREPVLGSEMMDVTVWFSDIAGFTPINENMTPTEMAQRLGHYLGKLSALIEGTDGTVVQYVGDEIMAFWGAPVPVERHAHAACDAALACCRLLPNLWDNDEVPVFWTRFGLHTAHVAVGHFGSDDRMYYGAIGDGINLTSRLEGANKFYGTEILISETTYALVKDDFEVRFVDEVALKGKQISIKIYELLGRPGTVDADRLARRAPYEAALELYRAGRFDEAIPLFRALAQPGEGGDEASRVMLARCEELVSDPPHDWRGVHVMTRK